jgi:hypothetical protein
MLYRLPNGDAIDLDHAKVIKVCIEEISSPKTYCVIVQSQMGDFIDYISWSVDNEALARAQRDLVIAEVEAHGARKRNPYWRNIEVTFGATTPKNKGKKHGRGPSLSDALDNANAFMPPIFFGW